MFLLDLTSKTTIFGRFRRVRVSRDSMTEHRLVDVPEWRDDLEDADVIHPSSEPEMDEEFEEREVSSTYPHYGCAWWSYFAAMT